MRVDEFAVLDDGHRSRWDSGGLKHLRGDAIDLATEFGWQVVDGLGGDRKGRQK
jgi:hypothetical protein